MTTAVTFRRRFTLIALVAATVVSGLLIATKFTPLPLDAQATGAPPAGWATQLPTNSSTSTNNQLEGTACPSSTECVGVGYGINGSGYWQTLATTWNGSSWSTASSQNTSSTQSNNLAGVSCTSTSWCMAVGNYYTGSVQQNLAETFNGTSWTGISVANTSTSRNNQLTGVYCLTSSNCYAVGYATDTSGYSQTLVENYNGSSWSILTSANTSATQHNYMTGISCASSTDCMTSGYYNTGSYMQVSVETLSSGTFVGQSGGYNAGSSASNYMTGVSCVSSGDCWFSGYWVDTGKDDMEMQIFNHTTSGFNGFAQNQANTSYNNVLDGVTCTSWSDCIAVGWYCQSSGCSTTSGELTEIEQWDGSTWYLATSTNHNGTSDQTALASVACVPAASPDNCMAVGNYCESSSNCPGGANASSQTMGEQYGGPVQYGPQGGSAWGAAAGTGDQSESAPSAPSTHIGPVNATSGNLYRGYTDTSIPARGFPLNLTRSFNSTPEATTASNDNYLQGTTCVTSSNCWAVGYYCTNIGSGNCTLGSYAQNLIEHYDGSAWTSVPSPDSGSGVSNQLDGVSCASATSCWAVGYYTDSSGYSQTLTEYYTGGSGNCSCWSILSSPNTSATQNNYLLSVSCVSASWCMTAGYYTNGSSVNQNLELNYNGTNWSGETISNQGSNSNQLHGISCTSTSSCSTVGFYSNGSGYWQTLAEQWGTSWSIATSGNTSSTQNNQLFSVSCVSTTFCVAAGYYYTGSVYQNLAEQYGGSSWSGITVSNTSSTQNNLLVGVSCYSSSDCETVGAYLGTQWQTLIVHFTSFSPVTSSVSTSPNGSTSVLNTLQGVSCDSTTDCKTAGYYAPSTHQQLVEAYNGTSWSIPSGANIPAGGAGNVWSSGIESAFGFGWSSNFASTSLYENAANTQVTIVDATGSPITFNLVGSTWTAPYYNASTLTSSGGVWTYTKWNGAVLKFNSTGQLTSEADRNGNTTTVNYTSGKLSSVSDATPSPNTRSLTFTFTGNTISEVDEPAVGGTTYKVLYSYDPSGDLTKVTNQNNNSVTFTYDGNHNMLSETDAVGNTFYYAYSQSTGQVLTTSAPAGAGGSGNRVTSFAYTPGTNSLTTLVTDPLLNQTQLSFNYSLLTKRVDAYGTALAATSSYLYDPNTLGVYQATDPLSTVRYYIYNINSDLLSTTTTPVTGTPSSITTSATYNSLNEPVTQTDPNGNITYSLYDTDGNLCWSVVGTSGGSSCSSPPSGAKVLSICETSTTCSVSGNTYYQGDVESVTDENGTGHTTTVAYDSYGDVSSSTDAGSNKSCFTYDILGRKLTSTPPLGSCSSTSAYTTTYTYNPLNEVLNTTYPDPSSGSGGTVTKINTYDANGNVLTTKLPLTGSTYQWATTTYDADNEKCWTDVTSSQLSTPVCGTIPRSSTDATTSATYDADGNVATANDANNNQTSYVYNALNQKTSVTDALGDKASYTYDANSNVLTAISPNGNATGCTGTCVTQHTTTNTYDGYNRLTSSVDPNNNTSTISYDADGNKKSVTDGSGNVTSFGYDNKNRTCWTYTSTSAAGSNACGSPPSYASGNGPVIKTFDNVGNVTKVEDQNQNYTTNLYNNLNQLCWTYMGSSSTSTCSPAQSNSTSYTYDADGNTTQITTPMGNSIYNTYNDANLVCVVDDGTSGNACGSTSSSTLTTYGYDAAGRKTAMGDGPGSSSWVFNTLGQITSYTNWAGQQVQYTPDANGNETKITYPSGTIVSQAFNGANQTCWTWVGNSTNDCAHVPTGPPSATTYGYDHNGNLTSESLANGVTNTYSFDGTNSISSISDGSGGSVFAATYGRNADNLLSSDSSQPANTHYTYTAQNRLCYAYSSSQTCGSTNSGAYAYSYDAGGNLTSNKGTYQSFYTATSGQTDQLCWTATTNVACTGTQPTGATSFTYNTNGDRTKSTPPSPTNPSNYSWNHLNQMTQYQLGTGTTTSYAYDGTGLRMSKTTGSSTTNFAWTGTGASPLLLQEKTGTNTTTYVYGPSGQPIEEILPSGSVYYYSHDSLGNTRALTDSSGTRQNTDTYDPYGNITASTGTVQNNLLFNGQYLDSESGLYYLRARYYDPSTAQFMSVDPAVASTGQPYAYTGGDPVNAGDPSGLKFSLDDGLDNTNACQICYTYATHYSPGTSYSTIAAQRASYVSASTGPGGLLSQEIAARAAAQAAEEEAAHHAAVVATAMNNYQAQVAEMRASDHTGLALGITGVAVGAAVCVFGGCEALATSLGGAALVNRVANSFSNNPEADNAATTLTPSESGQLIGWGTSQSSQAVAQTESVTANLTTDQVAQWAQSGLSKDWVQQNLAQYQSALADPAKASANAQLGPRSLLMQKILDLWPS